MEQNPIPKKAAPWDEISGERFLRNLLYAPMTMTKYSSVKDDLFDNSVPVGVDPRQIAQRIMEIRVQLSKEFVQDLNAIADDNNTLLREALQASMASEMTTEHPAKPAPKEITPPPQPEKKLVVHPELMTSDGILYPEVAKLYPDLAKAIKKQQQEARNDARRK